MADVDLLIHARWIIPVQPTNRALEHHSLAIRDGRIVLLVPRNDTASLRARETITLDQHALLPGLVNAHTHAAMSLFRGLADDLPLMEWLNKHIWPAEMKWVGDEFVRDGTQIAIAEMLKSGTTCFNDMYFFPETTAHVAQEAGIRACVGLILIDFPSAWAQSADEYLHKGLQLHDDLRHNALVTTAFAPHAPYTVSNGPLEKIAMYADELDIPIHMHVHETAHEVEESLARFGVRPLERLASRGLLGPRLIAVHMTQLLKEEIDALAQNNVGVVHCPASNLKLASGFCEVDRLLKSGVNVALGTDGAASNNNLDMLEELHLAALLAKGVAREATALPAHAALRMATINGARALGLDDRIGTLEPGKSADIIAIDLSDIGSQPVYDPASQIVYSASREQVTDVWVAGRRLVTSGQLTTLDENDLRSKAGNWRDKILASNSVVR
jgi:5-methylthioadenosine/S-adenosylhomocysteine deaminase